MRTNEFTPADMQIVMLANERVWLALKLTDSEEHLGTKSRGARSSWSVPRAENETLRSL